MEKQKPISIAIRETKQELVEVLNNSGLPIDVMVMIVAGLFNSINEQAERSYTQDVENYKSETDEC